MKVDEPRNGRPRDPLLEQRAYAAAREVYAARGWSGFGFNQVAQVAGIGKGALYRRWSSPIELLLDALTGPTPQDRVYFSVREELADFAAHILRRYTSESGLAPIRLFVEAKAHPEMFDAFRARILGPNLRRVRDIVRRGISTGEIDPEVDITLLLDIIHGAVISHALVQPQNSAPMNDEAVDAFARALIAKVLPRLPES